jgi:glycine cleavage system H protein
LPGRRIGTAGRGAGLFQNPERTNFMADERYPAELRYHREHDWARVEGEIATFGITWFAQDNLNEIVYFDPPNLGTQVTKDQPYAEIESVKAVSEVYAPLSGEVVEVNMALANGAGTINNDPYGQGWLVKVRMSDPSEADLLLSAEEYQATIKA